MIHSWLLAPLRRSHPVSSLRYCSERVGLSGASTWGREARPGGTTPRCLPVPSLLGCIRHTRRWPRRAVSAPVLRLSRDSRCDRSRHASRPGSPPATARRCSGRCRARRSGGPLRSRSARQAVLLRRRRPGLLRLLGFGPRGLALRRPSGATDFGGASCPADGGCLVADRPGRRRLASRPRGYLRRRGLGHPCAADPRAGGVSACARVPRRPPALSSVTARS